MKILTKLTSLVLLLTFLLSLFSCGKIKDPIAENPELMDNVSTWIPLLSGEEAEQTMGLYGSQFSYKNCVYYRDYYTFVNPKTGTQSKRYTIVRYDAYTGITRPACMDSACAHMDQNCPFYQADDILAFRIVDEMLYYQTAKYVNGKVNTSQKGGIHSYNLDTMEYTYLCDWEACDNTGLHYYDGNIYFVQCELHKNDNGYDKCIWSYNLKSDEKEMLFVYGDKSDGVLAGRSPYRVDAQGYMIFLHLPSDYELMNFITPQTIIFEKAKLVKNAEIETAAEVEAKFSTFSFQGLRYYDGKYFFPELAGTETISYLKDGKETQETRSKFSIYCVDLATGECKLLVENTVLGYDIAGDYLYYLPFKPEVVEYENGRQDVFATRGTIMQYNLQSGETNTFSVNEDLELGSFYFYYFRGRLLVYIRDHAKGDVSETAVEYDILTGEYRAISESIINPAVAYVQD